jgi:uncharacterized protein
MQRRDDKSLLFSPTDLVNFLGCAHSTVLDLKSFCEPLLKDEASESDLLLRRKGAEHEARYVESLKMTGKSVAVIGSDLSLAERARATSEAAQIGADVIYQAALLGENWHGYADFLEKTNRPSNLGPYSYEVTDTKLARHPQVKHLIQLGVYSSLLVGRQGVRPERCYLVLGDGSIESFNVKEFASYVRHAMGRLETFSASPPANSYPEPCAHCSKCHWKETCTAQWIADDHLSLVANIKRTQITKLERAGIKTVAQLAATAKSTGIPELTSEVFERLQSQAALQEHKRKTGENRIELLVSAAGRGFERLPEPDAGDLFFDMEGDPLYPAGLEYLFGVCVDNSGKLTFVEFWAHDHEEERDAFASFMGFLGEHLNKHPQAFIYHYNVYETAALKRLACRYAIAEHQLDDLLRRKKFVDLYQVVREAVRVSEPGYSIKNLETFYMDKRGGAVATAGDSIVVYNRWRETREPELLQQIADYNKVDCISTAKLRDWLLTHRPATLPWFDAAAPKFDAEEVTDKTDERRQREAEFADCQSRLLGGAKAAAHRQHLADALEFHAREGRPQWWEFFGRQSRFEDELLDDTECLAGLTLVGAPESIKRSLRHTYRFPPQETKLKDGDDVIDVATLERAGSIEHLDDDQLTVQIKRGAKSGPLPSRLSVGPGGPIDSGALRSAIYRFAKDELDGGKSYSAIRDILSRALPRFKTRACGEPIIKGVDLLAETTEAVADLADSYLFIQGPPGTGKTYTSASVIVDLIRRGAKIGVAANSHKAIHNLLERIEEIAKERGLKFRGVKKSSGGNAESQFNGEFIQSEDKAEKIDLSASLIAGTAWLFANERFDQHLDYLIIDEAGQVAVANVIAMGTAARNIVLVGDQMQLGQPIQGVHPGEAGSSVLDFLLGTTPTVAPDRGAFLNETRRLEPTLCRFISEAFYDGRLTPHPSNALRHLTFDSPIGGISEHGLHFIPVSHAGCSQKSEEEGAVVDEYFHRLIAQTFVDKDGSARRISAHDILVVSPYNVQVNHLKSVLPVGARVGTVDKFQGQEAPIVLVSMATSDAECMPRDIEFLFSANRLNVAVSRAQCLAIVVASPKLLETPCNTIGQLKLVNKFCQLVDFAANCGRT